MIGKKKKILNLNNYRNWNHFLSNEIKKVYSEVAIWELKKKLKKKKFKNKLELTFDYFKPSARKSDRANVLCIHEKFFCDAMTKSGCIIDDDDTVIERTIYQGGQIDRKNPRVEITIKELCNKNH